MLVIYKWKAYNHEPILEADASLQSKGCSAMDSDPICCTSYIILQ